MIQTIREELAPEPWNYSSLVVGDDTERDIWAEIDQHPLDNKARMVLIRDAEKLVHWDRLYDWMKHKATNPNTHLILVSNEPKIARLPGEDRTRGDVLPHIAAISAKGIAVECRPYTNATAKHAVAWVQSKVKMRDGIAGYLLNRANGDLRLVRDLCTKLAVFPEEISITTINGMLQEQPRDDFADALLRLDKKTALLALETIDYTEYSRIIGLLDTKLDLAGMIHDMQSEYKTISEINARAGNKNFLVKDLLPVSKHYDYKRRLQIREVLAIADTSLREGATVGVMEAVVGFW